MNGYQCGDCGCEPCMCETIRKKQRVKDGEEALQAVRQASEHLQGWKRKLISWLWPDFIHMLDEIHQYTEINGRWKNGKKTRTNF